MDFTLFVTSKCNLKCRYCYEGNKKSNRDMTKETADKTVEFIADRIKESGSSGLINITFHGGEPLLNFELIKYISSCILKEIHNEVIFNMTTNGTIMTDEMVDYIKNHINNISVSIDGTRKAHDLNRTFYDGTGSYEKAVFNAERLLAKGINVRGRMTFDSQNVGELYEGVKSLVDMGFRYIVSVADLYDERWNEENIEILKKQILKVSNIKKKSPHQEISLTAADLFSRKKGDCFGGVANYTIDSDGSIYPCTFSAGNKDFVIGNVNDGNLLKERICKLIEIYQKENKCCAGCTRYEYCEGVRCKILNKLITGDYTTPPGIVCAVENIRVDIMKKLLNVS